VSNFFTPLSKKAPEKLSWRVVESSLIVGKYNASDSNNDSIIENSKQKRIAAFDFDSTLIKTVSKLKFAKDATDWCWWHGAVPGKLKELHSEGYIIVIVSNQNGISLKRAANAPKVIKLDRFTQFKQKSAAVFNNLNLPISIYAATERDRFRKPATGMWEEVLKDLGLSKKDVDLEESIFVGDAGGRKGDFSCSDRNFAANIGIGFITPEEYFLQQPPEPYERTFDPSSHLANHPELPLEVMFQQDQGQEIALFVGSPGAGKSTFYNEHFKPLGYERINQDILKTVRYHSY
jgi:bifunctional polynucleotide phosphatase/kinase